MFVRFYSPDGLGLQLGLLYVPGRFYLTRPGDRRMRPITADSVSQIEKNELSCAQRSRLRIPPPRRTL